MNDVIEELREHSLVYLAAEPTPKIRMEDGSLDEWAPGSDDLYAAMEALTLQRVSVTQSPDEYHEAVVILLTENFAESPFVNKVIARARKMKLPLYTIRPDNMRLARAK